LPLHIGIDLAELKRVHSARFKSIVVLNLAYEIEANRAG
jgi:hypothetical protein